MASSPNKDVMRYELDITDIEAKAKRIQDLLDQVAKGRAGGSNTSGVEAELAKIKAALDALEQKGAKASSVGGGGAGAAAEQAAAKFEKLGEATAGAGEELFDFERKGEKLVKGALGALSPQLASAADMAIDLAEGFTKVSPALLAVGGAGAAIGLVTLALTQMSAALRDAQEKLERLSEAQRAFREKAVQGQGSFADELLKVGVTGGAQGANETFMRLASGGMPQAMARQVATASAYAQANGLPFDEQQFAAGLARAGGQMPGAENAMQFGGVVRQLMSAGGQPGSEQVLRTFLADRAQQTAAENVTLPTTTPSARAVTTDQIIAEKLARGDITDEQAKKARAFLLDPAARDAAALREQAAAAESSRFATDAFGLTGNEQRIALDIARQAEREAGERSLGGPGFDAAFQAASEEFNRKGWRHLTRNPEKMRAFLLDPARRRRAQDKYGPHDKDKPDDYDRWMKSPGFDVSEAVLRDESEEFDREMFRLGYRRPRQSTIDGPERGSAPQPFQQVIIGTQFNGGGNARMNPAYDAKVAAPGAGMMDRSQP